VEAEQKRREPFEPPGITTDLASLTDGRREGEFRSHYPWQIWIQIWGELAYLLLVLIGSFAALVLLAKYTVLKETDGLIHSLIGPPPSGNDLVIWAAVTLGGACGGSTFALKWLYHTVAKQRWHRDRLIWRLVVPILSAMLAVFSGLMIVSGLVPFLSKTPLTLPSTGAAYGFFVGLFSDNLLAGLQKLAHRIFGTVDKSSHSEEAKSDPTK
jgi:hypothetical protein